jgi:hypothetical protein
LGGKSSASFTVRPRQLTSGNYNDDLEVRYNFGQNVDIVIPVTFNVIPSTNHAISLNQSGTYTFADTDPLTVTIRNTGADPVANAKAALTGADADSFEISGITGNLAAQSDTATFTVNPKDGLPAGRYTASVVVTADNGLLESFTVRYVVLPTETNIISVTVSASAAHAAAGADVFMVAYNANGTMAGTLPAQSLIEGEHTYGFDTSSLATGDYTWKAFVWTSDGYVPLTPSQTA